MFPLPLAHASPDHKIIRGLYGERSALEVYDLADLEGDDSADRAYGSDRDRPERVVANALYTDWFLLGTQSCDLEEGEKRRPVESCFVLRVKTVHGIFTRTRIAVAKDEERLTLDEILRRYAADECEKHALDASAPITYGQRVRSVASAWEPSQSLRELRNKLRTLFDSLVASPSWFHLPADTEHGIPEAFVDLSAPFAVLRKSLMTLLHPQDMRRATLNAEKTLILASSFAGRISRPALDEEEKPEKLVQPRKPDAAT